MDAAQIRRCVDACINERISFEKATIYFLLDALEQARRERDGGVLVATKLLAQREQAQQDCEAKAFRQMVAHATAVEAQRDQAQQSAKDARALLGEAKAKLRDLGFGNEICARIEAMLEQKP
jgi:hypothetical protein